MLSHNPNCLSRQRKSDMQPASNASDYKSKPYTSSDSWCDYLAQDSTQTAGQLKQKKDEFIITKAMLKIVRKELIERSNSCIPSHLPPSYAASICQLPDKRESSFSLVIKIFLGMNTTSSYYYSHEKQENIKEPLPSYNTLGDVPPDYNNI